MRGKRWVMAYEGDRTGCRVTAAARIEVGQRLTAGREACVPRISGGLEVMILGLTCEDASRHASEACL
jgi:hypothetical protein